STVVHDGTERGTCCDNGLVCACDAYTCRHDPARAYCQCGSTFSVSQVVQGNAVAECPAPGVEEKCCLSTETNTCICAMLDCDEGAVGVPSCGLAAVAVCPATSPAVGACK